MRAMDLTGPAQVQLRDVPAPAIEQATDVRLRMDRVGVCGSDVHYFQTGRIGDRVVKFPFRMGHECSGTVLELGSAVSRVRVGDRVAIDPAVSCHQCDQCHAGRANTCRNLRFLGCPGELSGALCEQLVMPEDCLFPLPENVTLDQAVLAEPLSVGAYAVRQSQIKPGQTAAILGAGPIGLSVLIAWQYHNGANVYMTDRIDHRVNLAATHGAAWTGNPDQQNIVKEILDQQPGGVDVVFECAGQQETVDQAMELLKPGGKLMMVGIPRHERISMTIDQARRNELSFINVRRQNNCVAPALEIIASGKADVDFMVTHHFPFEQTQQAFELVAGYKNGIIKAIITL